DVLKNDGSLLDAAKAINKSKSFIYNKIRRGRRFNNQIQLFPYKPIPKLRITLAQIMQRINYLQQFPINNQFKLLNVLKKKIYYDEKSFELGNIPKNKVFWSEIPDISHRFYTKEKNSLIINVFSAASWFGK